MEVPVITNEQTEKMRLLRAIFGPSEETKQQIRKLLPRGIVAGMLSQVQAELHIVENFFDITLDEILSPEYIEKYVLPDVLMNYGEKVPIETAIKNGVEMHLGELLTWKDVKKHDDIFHDRVLFSVCPRSSQKDMTIAAETYDSAELIRRLAADAAEEKGISIDAYCIQQYGISIDALLEPKSKHYAPIIAGELTCIANDYDNPINCKSIHNIACRVKAADTPDADVAELANAVVNAFAILCLVASRMKMTVDELCVKLFEHDAQTVFDPVNEHYVFKHINSVAMTDDEGSCLMAENGVTSKPLKLDKWMETMVLTAYSKKSELVSHLLTAALAYFYPEETAEFFENAKLANEQKTSEE